MLMRRRRPLMRAAMVGGVAYHAGKKVQGGRDEDAQTDARLSQVENQQAQAAPAAGISDNTIEQLGKLGELHEQGVLTDEEFEAQKQKLLGAS
jgi:hypothetical protein